MMMLRGLFARFLLEIDTNRSSTVNTLLAFQLSSSGGGVRFGRDFSPTFFWTYGDEMHT